MTVVLLVDLAFPANGEAKGLGERIHHRNPHAVKPTGHLVAIVIELTAGMKDGHDDLSRGNTLLRVQIDGNTPAVIPDGDRFPFMHNHRNFRAVSREGLIDGVIYKLLNHVVQARAVIRIADVHTGALTHRIKAL